MDGSKVEYAFFYLRDKSYLESIKNPHLPDVYTNRREKDKETADEQMLHWREKEIPALNRPRVDYKAEWMENATTPEIKLPEILQTTAQKGTPQWQSAFERWRDTWAHYSIMVSDDGTIQGEEKDKAENFNAEFTKGRLGQFADIKSKKPLEDTIFEQLQEAIENRHPEHHEVDNSTVTPLQRELDQQDQFLQLASTGFIRRTGDFDALYGYLNPKNGETRPFALHARAGMGKTSLLAAFIAECTDEVKKETVPHFNGNNLYYRFIGGGDDSATVEQLIRSLLTQLKADGRIQQEIPDDPIQMVVKFPSFLEEAGKAGETVIVIDSLNQLASGLSKLDWIPRILPDNVKFIVSFKTESEVENAYLAQVQKDGLMVLHEVNSFEDPEERHKLVNAYLGQYFKELDESRIQELIQAKGANNPLFLKVILGELRVFGAFEQLNDKIRNDFGETTESAFNAVLVRLESEQSTAAISPHESVPCLMAWLAHSFGGLTVEDLASLLVHEKVAKNQTEALDAVHSVLRQLRPYLMKRDGRTDFLYESFKKAAIARYTVYHELARPVKEWHCSLAAWGMESYSHNTEQMPDYPLLWLPSHLFAVDDEESGKQAVLLLKDFRYLMEKLRRGALERLLADFRELPPALRNPLDIEAAFFAEKAHILRRGNADWPAYKILLQLSVEHADDSPLTIGAEQWLAEDRCNWFWLRRPLRLVHAQKNPCLAVFEGHTSDVNGALLLTHGRILSWEKYKDILRLWDGQNGRPLAVLKGHTGWVNGALVLNDGRILSWARDNTLRVWDEQSGQPLMVLEENTHLPAWGSRQVIGALELSDGRILSWSDNWALRLWDGQNGQPLAVLKGLTPTGSIKGALELRDRRILSWSDDNTLRLWDGQNGQPLAVLKGHTDNIEGALELLDGRILSWSWDNTLRLWDGQSGKLFTKLWHSDWVIGALELSDGRILSWAGHTLRLWDGQSGQPLAVLAGHTGGVYDALVLSNGRILSWSGDHILRLWDGQSGQPLAVLKGHTDNIEGALELIDGRILSWSWDKTLRLWDEQNGQSLAVLEGHTEKVNGVLELRDERILSWADDKTLRLWDEQSGQPLLVLEGHTDYIEGALELSDRWIISWGDRLRVWDGQSGQPLTAPESFDNTLQLSDGRILSWAEGDTLRLWDEQGGQLLAVLKGHTQNQNIEGALELIDGRILSWSCDATLRLWDGQSGQPLVVLKGHSDGIADALELSAGRILSWAWDDTVRVWDGQSGECLEVYVLHPEWDYLQVKMVAVNFFGKSESRSLQLHHQLHHRIYSKVLAIWEADSMAKFHTLQSDGTIMATQANGQVCILKLYRGNRRISLAEAEVLLFPSKTLSVPSKSSSFEDKTKVEKVHTYAQAIDLKHAGKIEEAKALDRSVPFAPWAAEFIKKYVGLDALLSADLNLAEVEEKYGKEWLIR
jgi:WD40 repeat protein